MSEALMLRVDHTFKTKQATQDAMEALSTMANIQIDHHLPDVVMYHFTRPFPETRPTYMEFTEIYANEAVFWSHSKVDPKFGKAFMSGFDPAGKERSFFYSYGENISEAVIKTCNFLDSKYPATTAGYTLKKSEVARDPDEDQDPVLLKLLIKAKKTKGERGLFNPQENVDKLCALFSEMALLDSNRAFSFHLSRPEPKTQPDIFELIVGYSSNKRTSNFFTDQKAKLLCQEAKESASINCDVYGTIAADTKEVLSTTGFDCSYKATDIGYVLHPEAVA